MKKIIIVLILVFIFFGVLISKIPKVEKEVIIIGNVISINTNSLAENNDYSMNGKIKTSANNIGVVTCVNLDNNRIVALGHSIVKEEEKITGEFYNAKIYNIKKAANGKAGSIEAKKNKTERSGTIEENLKTGVYGKIENDIIDQSNKIKIASKFEILPGKASIKINLDGQELKEYNVRIIGIDYFDDNKNINIIVEDEELLKLTGGIVKGMSGTPLIQNGKLVGAINYVSENNPKDAYAVFADKLF